MMTPVYGSWCSYKTAESEAVTKDRAALEILCGSLLRHRRKNGESSWLRPGGGDPGSFSPLRIRRFWTGNLPLSGAGMPVIREEPVLASGSCQWHVASWPVGDEKTRENSENRNGQH